MRRLLKSTMAAVLAIGCTAGLASAQGLKEAKDVKIAFVVHGSAADAYWIVVKRGVDDAAALTGAKVDYLRAAGVRRRRAGAPDRRCRSPRKPGRPRRLHPRCRRHAGRSTKALAAGIPVVVLDSGEKAGAEMGRRPLCRHRLRVRFRRQGGRAAGQGRHPQGRLHQPRGRQCQPRRALPGHQRRPEAMRAAAPRWPRRQPRPGRDHPADRGLS